MLLVFSCGDWGGEKKNATQMFPEVSLIQGGSWWGQHQDKVSSNLPLCFMASLMLSGFLQIFLCFSPLTPVSWFCWLFITLNFEAAPSSLLWLQVKCGSISFIICLSCPGSQEEAMWARHSLGLGVVGAYIPQIP
jgi:hypothetical protein